MRLTLPLVCTFVLFCLGCNCGEGEPPPPTFSFQLIDGQTDENLLSDSTKLAYLSIESEQRHLWISYNPWNQSVEITFFANMDLEIRWKESEAFLVKVVTKEEGDRCNDNTYIDDVIVEGADLEEPPTGSETYRILL